MSKVGFFLLSVLALIITAFLIPGIGIANLAVAFVTALVISFINMFLKPILQFLSLPLTVLTLGLFYLVVNGFLFLLASWIVPGFTIVNIWWAILAAIVYSLINTFLAYIFTGDS